MERGLPTPQKHAVRQVLRHTQNVSPDSAVSGVRTCISEQKQTLCFSRRASPFHYAQYTNHESIPHIMYISIPQSRHAPATLNSTLFVNCQPLSRQLYKSVKFSLPHSKHSLILLPVCVGFTWNNCECWNWLNSLANGFFSPILNHPRIVSWAPLRVPAPMRVLWYARYGSSPLRGRTPA